MPLERPPLDAQIVGEDRKAQRPWFEYFDELRRYINTLVVSTNTETTSKTDATSSNASTWTDISGLSVTITPNSSNGTVLVRAFINVDVAAGPYRTGFRLVRTSTAIGVADTAGSRELCTSAVSSTTTESDLTTVYLEFEDSPATTSATTYKVQLKNLNSGTTYINRTITDTDSSAFPRMISGITATEIQE